MNAKTVTRFWIALVALCALLPALSACATFKGGPIEGRLVDANSGEPVTNAIVYGEWEGILTALLDTAPYCIWAESARPDAQGRFVLPAWSKQDPRALSTSNVDADIFAYAPGYEITPIPGNKQNVQMKPFVGTTDQRLRKLGRLDCVPDDSLHRVAVVYRMMADEMEHLAVTADQRRAAREVRERAKSARTDFSKPTTHNEYGYRVNINPNDQYPE